MKRSDFKKEEELKGMKVGDIRKHIEAFNRHYAIEGYSKLKKAALISAVLSAQTRLGGAKKTKKKVKLVIVEEPKKASPVAKKASPVAKKASPVAKKASPVAKKASPVAEKSPLTLDETEDLQNLEIKFLALQHLDNSNRPYGTYESKWIRDNMKRSLKSYLGFRKTLAGLIVLDFMKSKLSKSGLPLDRVDRQANAKTMYDNIRFQFKRGNDKDVYKDDVRNNEPLIRQDGYQDYREAFVNAYEKIVGIDDGVKR